MSANRFKFRAWHHYEGTMNRRDFIKALSVGAASITAPKFIFDMGANSRIYAPRLELVPYCLYAVDDNGRPLPIDAILSRGFRFGAYQPNGEFYFGPGKVKIQERRTQNGYESIVVASMTAKHPVGSIF